MADELKDWLTFAPTGWAQLVCARASLRVLPRAVGGVSAPGMPLPNFSLAVFRAAAITWILRRSIRNQGQLELLQAGSSAAADAALGVRAAARAADHIDSVVALAADAIANATDAARADAYKAFVIRAAWDAILGALRFDAIHESVDRDRDQLAHWRDETPGELARRADTLARERLWPTPRWVQGLSRPPRPESITPPWFEESWADAQAKLNSHNEAFQVWIEWYDRVINGHGAGFGDTAAAEEYVASKLLKADQIFWDQGAAIVNRTILKWVDRVEIQNELLEASKRASLQKSKNIGSVGEVDFRAALVRQLELLSKVDSSGHGAIGHNQPPEPPNWRTDMVVLQDIADQAAAALEELAQPRPDPDLIRDKVSLIEMALERLSDLSRAGGAKAADAIAVALGMTVGLSIVSVATFAADDVIRAAVRWFAALV